MSQSKKAYINGGEKADKEARTRRPYKAEPAIVIQPRFKEPFYRNYDIYDTQGADGPAKHGPGVGWHSMQDYKSVSEFLADRRKKLKNKYISDDSWKQDDGSITKSPKKSKARISMLQSIIKMAEDVNNGPNFDYGKGLYANMDKYDSVKDFEEHANKGPGAIMSSDDVNYIDNPIDDQVTPIDNESDSSSATIGGMSDFLPQNDIEDKPPTNLNFGRDNESSPDLNQAKNQFKEEKLALFRKLHEMIDEFIENHNEDENDDEAVQSGEGPFYGLGNKLDEREDLADLSLNRPHNESQLGTDLFDKMWA